jgi:hypothetical protein
MKKFDNHVSKLQREMVDITNNLNKFRNKNHKTISLIINNLNVLSNEIAYNNNFGYDPNISNKNSQNDNSKTSVDLYKENKKQKNFSLQKNMEINKRNISNSLFSDNNNDNYMTFYISKNNNCVNKNQSNKTQTPRKQTLRINNIKNNKYNEYFNEFLNNDLKTNKNNQTFNRNNNKHKKIFKNNSISIKKEHKKENVNNRAFKNDDKYMKTEMGNKKKNNTITNLLFNNKKDFIYFNKNKQNYFKQNNNQQNSNKNQTSNFFHRNQDNKSHKNPKRTRRAASRFNCLFMAIEPRLPPHYSPKSPAPIHAAYQKRTRPSHEVSCHPRTGRSDHSLPPEACIQALQRAQGAV